MAQTETFNLSTGQIYRRDFDTSVWIHNEIENKVVVVESSGPVSVHGWNAGRAMSAAFKANLITAEDREFVVPNYDRTENTTLYISAAAVEGSNSVLVTFTVGGGEFKTPGSKHCLTVISSGSYYFPGSTVSSLIPASPVAVYTGHNEAQIPSGTESYGQIWNSVIATHQLGTDYIVPPIAGRSSSAGYIVRIFAPNTGSTDVLQYNVTTGNFEIIGTLSQREHIEIESAATNEHLSIRCSQTCSVKQFNKGKAADSSQTGPFMMSIPPLNKYVDTASFVAPKSSSRLGNNEKSFVSIISTGGGVDKLKLNCDGMSQQTWRPVAELSGYKYTAFSIDSDKIYCLSDNSTNGLFAVCVYGHGSPGNGYGFLATDLADSNGTRKAFILKFSFVTLGSCTVSRCPRIFFVHST